MLSPVRLASRDKVVSPPISAMVSSNVSARATDWMLEPSVLRRDRPPLVGRLFSATTAAASVMRGSLKLALRAYLLELAWKKTPGGGPSQALFEMMRRGFQDAKSGTTRFG